MTKSFIQNVTQNGNKLIIYCQFPTVLKKIEHFCSEEKIKTFYIDGSVNSRADIIQGFESSLEGVFLISLKAGGVGMNLTSCQYMLLYEPWWNSAAENQASNRIYRIGQKKNVFIYHLIVKNTIGEKIVELQRQKNKVFFDTLEDLGNKQWQSLDGIKEIIMSL